MMNRIRLCAIILACFVAAVNFAVAAAVYFAKDEKIKKKLSFFYAAARVALVVLLAFVMLIKA